MLLSEPEPEVSFCRRGDSEMARSADAYHPEYYIVVSEQSDLAFLPRAEPCFAQDVAHESSGVHAEGHDAVAATRRSDFYFRCIV